MFIIITVIVITIIIVYVYFCLSAFALFIPVLFKINYLEVAYAKQ